jgi:hypothetical protein
MEGAVRLNRFGGNFCVSISETLLASIGVRAPELGPAKRTGPTRVLGAAGRGDRAKEEGHVKKSLMLAVFVMAILSSPAVADHHFR